MMISSTEDAEPLPAEDLNDVGNAINVSIDRLF